MKNDANPMHRANSAPRCKAKSKRTGLPCQAPAVRGWTVCRMHGARGGHGHGKANPAFKHGVRGRKSVELRKAVNKLVKMQKEFCGRLD